MTHANTASYINVLHNIVDNYNNSHHRILKSTPSQVHNLQNPISIKEIFTLMYKNKTPKSKTLSLPLSLGQTVRIADESRNKAFRTGYKVQNTWEIFKISKVDTSQQPTVYYLVDLQEEPILGLFYREELIPTSLPPSYDIQILKTKKVGNKTKHLVTWIGYPSKFNSWIDAADLILS